MRLLLPLFLLLVLALLAGCPKPPSTDQAAQDPVDPASTTAPDTMQPPASDNDIGSVAADFAFVTLDGQTKRLSEYKGQPVVVNFWGDWCPPCKAELPDFQEVYTASKHKFTMLGITDSKSTDPKGFVEANGYDWVFGTSEEGPRAYAVDAWPATYFIDRTGIVRASQIGMIDRATFESSLQQIL